MTAAELDAVMAEAGLDTPEKRAFAGAVLRHLKGGADPSETFAAAAGQGGRHGSALDFFAGLKWLDGTPLAAHIEPYRAAIFAAVLDDREPAGRPRFNLALCGRGKKNWKSADLVLAALWKLFADAPGGTQCYLIANDEEQAGDDLSLAKLLIAVNPPLQDRLTVRQKHIDRRDGKGTLAILPAGDIAGSHGKTYAFVGYDEIHAYKDWGILEAMQPDPTRPDALQWITSYASLLHRPGVPLFDLMARGKAGADPRMYFSWYAADFTTDPAAAALDPESRANPSRQSWADPDYLAQQRRRLPSHRYRRLHLNLPGLPEGSAFTAEMVMGAVERGRPHRESEPGTAYKAFVDMSGGSSDDAVIAVGHLDADGRAVVDRVLHQGQPPPFDPAKAVPRFAAELKRYGVRRVQGDAYAGETFKRRFEEEGVAYEVAPLPASKLYEALEPRLNGGRVALPDVPEVEQQLLGLVWKASKITHPPGEHDDYANAVAGLVHMLLAEGPAAPLAPMPGAVERVVVGLPISKEDLDWLRR